MGKRILRSIYSCGPAVRLQAWGRPVIAGLPLPLVVLLTILSAAAPLRAVPLLAVMPLRPLGAVSEEEAYTVGSLLETALVNSTAFQIVERTEIAEVLAAQEYSAEEFVVETFAVRVGKLLCAEQILIGTLSRLGDRYYVTAKIIDVATGRTLRAGKDEADTIAAIAAQSGALAHRLAGRPPTAETSAEDSRIERAMRTEPDPEIAATPAAAAAIPRQTLVEERSALRSERYRLERLLEAEILRSRRLKTAGLVCYGISGGFALASGVTLVLHFERSAPPARVPWGELGASFAVIAIVGAIVGTIIELERPDIEAIRDSIQQLEKQTRLSDSRIQ